MRVLLSEAKLSTAIVLAETFEDIKSLVFMYEHKLIFGCYILWVRDKDKIVPLDVKPFVDKFPNCYGVAVINVVKGYIEDEEDIKDGNKKCREVFELIRGMKDNVN